MTSLSAAPGFGGGIVTASDAATLDLYSHVCRGPAHVLRFYSDKFHWLMDAGLLELSWLDFSEERSPLPDFETSQLAKCFGIPPSIAFMDV